ncbi:MAG: EamA family transporter [Hyphomicrobiaceae bacterium]
MDSLWILISVFGALMQAVRTAAQKTLNQSMSNLGTTYVRSLAGLPVMALYLALIMATVQGGMPRLTVAYLAATCAGALAQVLATMLLIYLFKLRNFAIGSMLIKIDIIMTAALGSLLFSEQLSGTGLLALLVVLAGVLLISIARIGLDRLTTEQPSLMAALFALPTQVALGSAFFFTLSYLFLREATLLAEPGNFLWRGAWTVVIATLMQTVVLGAYVAWREPAVFAQLWPNRAIITFIGVTSALGSIAWFTAFALQNASYVRAVGQIEVVFTLLISWAYFKERLTRMELAGIALTIAGVLMFRLIAVT